jgi:preprotein translocase subunit YajC
MFFESIAFAMGAPQGGSGGPTEMFAQFIPLILMVGVFWFLLIRPQKKRQQEHKTMLENLRRGDTVVTTGGIIGRIVEIDGDIMTLDLGETKVRAGRGFISGLFDAKLPSAPKEKKGKSAPKENKALKKGEESETDDGAPEKQAENLEADSETSEERKEEKK